MSASLKLTSHCIVDIDGVPHEMGELTQARTVELTSELSTDLVYSLAAGATQLVYRRGDNLADFDFLWMESDFDVEVYIGIAATPDKVRLKIRGTGVAKSYGIPFILGYELIKYLGATNPLGDVIEEIRVYNPSADDTARVHVFIAT